MYDELHAICTTVSRQMGREAVHWGMLVQSGFQFFKSQRAFVRPDKIDLKFQERKFSSVCFRK